MSELLITWTFTKQENFNHYTFARSEEEFFRLMKKRYRASEKEIIIKKIELYAEEK